jgi:hypothetical protein
MRHLIQIKVDKEEKVMFSVLTRLNGTDPTKVLRKEVKKYLKKHQDKYEKIHSTN